MVSWRRRVLVGVFSLAVAVCLPRVAAAGEMDILLNKLVEKGVLSASEAQEVRNELGPELVKEDKALEERLKKAGPEWAQNTKWKGDLRLRNEYRNQTGSGQDVNRQRIRFRYGFETKANDQMVVGARLATGSTSDPISTNQNLGSSFNHKTIVLDRAYANYTPDVPGLDNVKLAAGMVENPFWLVPGQMVWDDDLNFEGAALHLDKQMGPVGLFANGGAFSLNTNIVRSSALWSIQGGVVVQPFKGEGELLDHLKLTAAQAYHDYMNVTGKASDATALTNAGGTKGNSTGLKDVNLLNSTFELSSQYAQVPLSLFGDWAHNTAAPSGNNGVLAGVKMGKAQVPFDLRKGWEAGYYFERLEPDATLGAFTNSDFGNGGTNHRGHVWWLKLAVLKNSTIGLTAFTTQELKGSKSHVDTYQMDWVTSF